MNSSYTGGVPKKNGIVGVGESSNLRRDVLKQSIASLAAAIGSVRYADDGHISASHKVTLLDPNTPEIMSAVQQPKELEEESPCGVSHIFSVQQMSTAAKHANEICLQYGASIVSINVISAVPT